MSDAIRSCSALSLPLLQAKHTVDFMVSITLAWESQSFHGLKVALCVRHAVVHDAKRRAAQAVHLYTPGMCIYQCDHAMAGEGDVHTWQR